MSEDLHAEHQAKVDAAVTAKAPEKTGNVAAIDRYLDALQANDIEGFMTLWAAVARQDMPYAPPNFTNSLATRQAVADQYGQLPGLYEYQRYFDREIFTTQDPNVVIVRFRGDIKLKDKDVKYDNHYINVFVFDGDGKIVRAIEHFNPLVLMQGKPFGDFDA